jgi:hypothetical protein
MDVCGVTKTIVFDVSTAGKCSNTTLAYSRCGDVRAVMVDAMGRRAVSVCRGSPDGESAQMQIKE